MAGAWQKALAHMSPEQLETSRKAVELHKAQEELRRQGVDVDKAMADLRMLHGEGEEGEGEGEEEETRLDRFITYAALVFAVIAVVVALVVGVSNGGSGS